MRSAKRYGVLLCVLVAMGCSQKTPSEYIEDAEAAMRKNDAETAVIVLKNALSSDPKNLRARFLLGSIYLQRGNVESAEKELKIAYDGGYFKNEVVPLYLGALNFLQQDDQIILLVETLTGLSAEAEAAAQAYKGMALFRKNEVSRAKLAIKRSADIAPDSPYSRLGRAHFARFDGEITDSIIILDELLLDDPDFMEAVLLRGELSMSQLDYKTAISDFEKYVAQKPALAKANFLLIDTLIRDEQYEVAEVKLADLLDKLPEHPKLNEFLGILKFRDGDYAGAKAAMEQALASGSNSAPVKLIAGVSAYQRSQLEQAHKHLASVQMVLPESHPAKRLFAEVQLRLGYSSEAAHTLANMVDFNLSDVRLFTQAGIDLVKRGDASSGQKMLDLAKKSPPNTVVEMTRLGILKLSLNDMSGIQDLLDAIQLDPKTVQAHIALVEAYLDNKQPEKATELARQWVAKIPEEITAYNLLAKVYEVTNKQELAKVTYEKALQLSPNNPASLKFLADQAKKDDAPQQALALLRQVAENNPEYLHGTFEYLIEAKAQSKEDAQHALKLMQSIHQNDPSDILKSLNYARGLVVMQQPQQAITVLNKVKPEIDMPVFYWKGRGDSYLALNKPKDALNVYSQWQQLEPKRKQAWEAAIIIYDGTRDFVGALDTVKQAKSFHPDDAEFQAMEVHYTLLNGNISVAQRLLDNIQPKFKSYSLFKGLQGRIYFAEQKFSEALPLLESYYKDSGEGRYALLIANVKTILGELDDGQEFMESHLQRVPSDLNIRARLAERYMEKQPEKAIEHYQVVLQSLPENILVLNNLGWLYAHTDNTAKAVDYAEKAVALRPENPKLLDTLGFALLKNGNVKRALEVSKKAFNLEPSNQIYRVHYEQAQAANQ